MWDKPVREAGSLQAQWGMVLLTHMTDILAWPWGQPGLPHNQFESRVHVGELEGTCMPERLLPLGCPGLGLGPRRGNGLMDQVTVAQLPAS